jgi:hypothetical protein
VIAAARVGWDLLFVTHLMTAVAVLIVLVTLRAGTMTVVTDPAAGRTRFPDRPDYAVRLVHLLPVSGLALSLWGGGRVAPDRPWVVAGLALYLVAAGLLEARVLPAERALARALVTHDGVATHAATLRRGLDGALAVIAVAMIVMIGQF